MTTLRKKAEDYKGQETKNIAELNVVSVDIETRMETRDGNDGPYEVNLVTIDDEDYRVPNSVLKQLQTQLKENPKMEYFKVIRAGTDKNNTVYTVVPK